MKDICYMQDRQFATTAAEQPAVFKDLLPSDCCQLMLQSSGSMLLLDTEDSFMML